jgi:hypothetical protein
MNRTGINSLIVLVLQMALAVFANCQTPEPITLGSLLTAEQKQKLDVSKLTPEEQAVILQVIKEGMTFAYDKGHKDGIALAVKAPGRKRIAQFV